MRNISVCAGGSSRGAFDYIRHWPNCCDRTSVHLAPNGIEASGQFRAGDRPRTLATYGGVPHSAQTHPLYGEESTGAACRLFYYWMRKFGDAVGRCALHSGVILIQ